MYFLALDTGFVVTERHSAPSCVNDVSARVLRFRRSLEQYLIECAVMKLLFLVSKIASFDVERTCKINIVLSLKMRVINLRRLLTNLSSEINHFAALCEQAWSWRCTYVRNYFFFSFFGKPDLSGKRREAVRKLYVVAK